MNFLQALVRNQRVQDVLGVTRGVLKVTSQLAKRSNYLTEDMQRFVGSVDKNLSSFVGKMEESIEFIQAANTIYNAGEGEEFITFDKPVFEYTKKKEPVVSEEKKAEERLFREYYESGSSNPSDLKQESRFTKKTIVNV